MKKLPSAKFVNKRGFTLIEILIAISIFAVISVIGFTSYRGSVVKAKIYKVRSDLHDMELNIQSARETNHETTMQLTGSTCSECDDACRPPHKTSDQTCINLMKATWLHITSAPLPIDPWGGAYTLDENETEPGKVMCCADHTGDWSHDYIRSAGPDNILYNNDDLFTPQGGALAIGVVSFACGSIVDRTATHC